MKILVTGAAGFVGSHLCERLAQTGHEVVGLDCYTEYYSRALKEQNAAEVRASGVEILRLDLAEDDLADAVQGAEIIYHLAAQPGIAAHVAFDTYVRNNITATYRLVEAAAGCGSLKLFVNVSTSSVYGTVATGSEQAEPKPASFYGVTKLAGEQLVMSYCREGKLPACSLRLFSVYGPRERPEKLYPKLIRSILEGSDFELYQGSEGHLRSFTYIADAVDGLVGPLKNIDECRGEIINIGSPMETRTSRGIEIIEQIMGKKARTVARAARRGDQLRTRANIEKARRLLGYNPRTATEDGLRAEVEWYKQKVHGRIVLERA
jgi:nucleoside-diphosphate-sugar epimerase